MYKDISAVIVTRGDVDLTEILESLPFIDVVVWDNSKKSWDAGSYGRYLGILDAKNDKIYFQDDDAIIPIGEIDRLIGGYVDGKIIASMPASHTSPLYPEQCLLGWGSLFRRDLPEKAFDIWSKYYLMTDGNWLKIYADFVFPGLTPNIRIDGVHINMPWAQADNRTYLQPGYEEKKQDIFDRIRRVRELERI